MKSRIIAILILFIGILVAGCSDGTKSNSEMSEADTSTEDPEPSGFGPLIDPDNAINERQVIAELVEEQKSRLKLGFITEDTPVDQISMSFDANAEEIGADEVTHSMDLWANENDLSIYFSNEGFICTDGMDEWTNDLNEREAFENERMEGFYGHDEHAHKQMVLKHNDICYDTSIFSEDGYHESDKRLFEILANTLKTEEEGAYDPIYSRFTLDLTEMKFPTINKERGLIAQTYLQYKEDDYDSSHSIIGVFYQIGEEFFRYEITDEEDPFSRFEVKEEIQTENGISVNKFEDSSIFSIYYTWTDGNLNYMININQEDMDLTEDDLLTLIDAAMEDERSFESLDFFKGVTEKPDLGEEELEILEKYYY